MSEIPHFQSPGRSRDDIEAAGLGGSFKSAGEGLCWLLSSSVALTPPRGNRGASRPTTGIAVTEPATLAWTR